MNNFYLALGDSITTGYGVGLENSFATIYFSNLSSCSPVLRYFNLGVNGLTTSGLCNMLQTKARNILTQASVISLTIGSNDLISIGKSLIQGTGINVDMALGRMTENLILLGNNIRIVNPAALVKIATIYNPVSVIDKQPQVLTQGIVLKANLSIALIAREFKFVLVPVDKAFSRQGQILLGADHLHPNLLGHKVIADLFTKA